MITGGGIGPTGGGSGGLGVNSLFSPDGTILYSSSTGDINSDVNVGVDPDQILQLTGLGKIPAVPSGDTIIVNPVTTLDDDLQSTLDDIYAAIIPGLDFGYVTVGGLSAQYPTITAALAAGKTKWWIIANFHETTDVQFSVSDDYEAICNAGVIVTFNDCGIVYNNSVCNLTWKGGTVLYAQTDTARDFIQFGGVGRGDFEFKSCKVQDLSTQPGSYFNNNPPGGTKQIFTNVEFFLPDQAGCGPRIAGGSSIGMAMVGGGTSCADCLTVIGGEVDGTRFTGVYSTSTTVTVSEAIFNGAYVGSNSGTPLVRVAALGNCEINGLLAKADAGFNVVAIGASIIVGALNTGALGQLFLGFGSSGIAVNNSILKSTSLTSSSVSPKFNNCNFLQTSDLTIQSPGASFSQCTAGSCQVVVDTNNVSLTTFQVGASGGSTYTITVNSGATNNNLIACTTEVAVVNNSGGATTDIIACKLWV